MENMTEKKHTESGKETMPENSETDDGTSTEATNHRGRKAFIILAVTVVIGILAVTGYIIMHLGQETTDNAQVDSTVVPLAARTGGQVVEVMVNDNQRVKKGDEILKIDDSDHSAKVSRAQAEYQMARAQLQVAQAQEQIINASATGGLDSARANVSGSSQAVLSATALVNSAQAALDRARADEKRAELELKRVSDLKVSDAVPQKRLDDAQVAFDVAHATAVQAQASLAAAEEQKRMAESKVVEARGRLAQSSPVEAQISAAHAQTELAKGRVKAAEADLELATNQLDYTTLIAPGDGIVSKLSVTVGQIISPGQPIAELVASESHVIANFKETQVGMMRLGDRAEIAIDAIPGKSFAGEVESISGGTGARFSLLPPDNATGNFVKVVQRIPVRIRWITHPDNGPLPAGLSAVVTVFTGSAQQGKTAEQEAMK